MDTPPIQSRTDLLSTDRDKTRILCVVAVAWISATKSTTLQHALYAFQLAELDARSSCDGRRRRDVVADSIRQIMVQRTLSIELCLSHRFQQCRFIHVAVNEAQKRREEATAAVFVI